MVGEQLGLPGSGDRHGYDRAACWGPRSETPGEGVRALPPPRARLLHDAPLVPKPHPLEPSTANGGSPTDWRTPSAPSDVEGAVLGPAVPGDRGVGQFLRCCPSRLPDESGPASRCCRRRPAAVVPFSVLPEPNPVRLSSSRCCGSRTRSSWSSSPSCRSRTRSSWSSSRSCRNRCPRLVVEFSVLPCPTAAGLRVAR